MKRVTAQSLLDARVNVFGLQLLLESLAGRGDGKLSFTFDHRGKTWSISISAKDQDEAE